MTVPIVYSRATLGVQAPLVHVETHLSPGLPAFNLVGLPETTVRESKDRVRSAIMNSGFEFPTRRITVNLAPADLPKHGTRYDLAIALGILAASGQVSSMRLATIECVAELALTGALRPVRGVLPAALACLRDGRAIVTAPDDERETSLVSALEAYAAGTLASVCRHLDGDASLERAQRAAPPECSVGGADLSDVRGQYQAKRALEVTASGGHNLLMLGPPGTGKTMLATRLAGIMPPLDEQEAFESAAVLSVSTRGFRLEDWGQRPFRSPHHTSSAVALVGGGSIPRPGEVSLAHHGVLFLDELPEFERRVLEVLREPLESGRVTIARAARSAEFPAAFQLVAAMNPCPCGYAGDRSGRCSCTPDQIDRYLARISGPLLDRIDLHIEVAREPESFEQNAAPPGETNAAVRERVTRARDRQRERQDGLNRNLAGAALRRHAALDDPSRRFLAQAVERFALSARACDRVLRVARTIADLDAASAIALDHVSEALSFRCLDRARSTVPSGH